MCPFPFEFKLETNELLYIEHHKCATLPVSTELEGRSMPFVEILYNVLAIFAKVLILGCASLNLAFIAH